MTLNNFETKKDSYFLSDIVEFFVVFVNFALYASFKAHISNVFPVG